MLVDVILTLLINLVLAAQRTKMTNPDDHMVLPETISKEPLGPVVRQGDSVWEDIVRWSLNTL